MLRQLLGPLATLGAEGRLFWISHWGFLGHVLVAVPHFWGYAGLSLAHSTGLRARRVVREPTGKADISMHQLLSLTQCFYAFPRSEPNRSVNTQDFGFSGRS